MKHDLTDLHLLTPSMWVADSCESSLSRRCSHIFVIVHSLTGHLCCSAMSHQSQPWHAVSIHPWGRWHRAGHPLSTQDEPVDTASLIYPHVFGFWQKQREEKGTNGGFSFGCTWVQFEAKQVGWSVMREDSWLVQWRLTAKCKRQRGRERELGLGSFWRSFWMF